MMIGVIRLQGDDGLVRMYGDDRCGRDGWW